MAKNNTFTLLHINICYTRIQFVKIKLFNTEKKKKGYETLKR